jgi:glycosyltransferase involved in cell wall biosynthesis
MAASAAPTPAASPVRRLVSVARRLARLRSPWRALLLRWARVQPSAAELAAADRRVVILVGSAWGMGGTIRAAINLAGHLARTNEVEILSAYRRRDRPFMVKQFPERVTVTALDDQRPGARPAWRERLAELVRGRGSVLLHPADVGYDGFSLLSDIRLVQALRGRAGTVIATRPGLNMLLADLQLPGFVTVGEEQMNLGAHSRALRRAIAQRYPRLDALAVLTDGDMAAYRELLGEDAPRLVRIPNTVQATKAPKADLDAKVVLAAGRLTPQKGFDLLIPAWRTVADARPDWQLVIRGRGERRAQLEGLIAEHGLQDHVTLGKAAKRLRRRMSEAAIYVLSSRFEGFPLVLLEAMEAGMAVVAFDCPTGPGDIIDDHRNGLLVAAKDVERLGAALLEMIEDDELRRRCAAGAIETAHEYTMDAVGPRWDALLADLRAAR